MIKTKVSYEVSYGTFDKKPSALDNAFENLFSVFGNDIDEIAIFLMDSLAKRKNEKLTAALKETAEDMRRASILGPQADSVLSSSLTDAIAQMQAQGINQINKIINQGDSIKPTDK